MGNIRTDQTELYQKIISLEKENAAMTIHLQRYATDFNVLHSHRRESSDFLSKAHIDSFDALHGTMR